MTTTVKAKDVRKGDDVTACQPCSLGEHPDVDGRSYCVCCGVLIVDGCPTCGGAGDIPVLPIPLDPQLHEDRPCPTCGGKGELPLATIEEIEADCA